MLVKIVVLLVKVINMDCFTERWPTCDLHMSCLIDSVLLVMSFVWKCG